MRKAATLLKACLFVAGVLFAPLCAATEQSDIAAGFRALPFLVNKISGETTIAIVYNPDVAESKADADNIQQIITAEAPLPGGVKPLPLLIKVNELGKLSRARIAFLTPGLGAHVSDISSATAAASILTISTDLGYVKSAQCILGVTTTPNVQIYFSKAAADAAKIEFSQDFLLLVKQQ